MQILKQAGRCIQVAKAECASSTWGFLGFYLRLTHAIEAFQTHLLEMLHTKEGGEMKFC